MEQYALLFRRVIAHIDCLDSLINWSHSSVGLIDLKVVVAGIDVEEPTSMR